MIDYLYPQLRRGLVGAWCPSMDRSRSTLLTDLSRFSNTSSRLGTGYHNATPKGLGVHINGTLGSTTDWGYRFASPVVDNTKPFTAICSFVVPDATTATQCVFGNTAEEYLDGFNINIQSGTSTIRLQVGGSGVYTTVNIYSFSPGSREHVTASIVFNYSTITCRVNNVVQSVSRTESIPSTYPLFIGATYRTATTVLYPFSSTITEASVYQQALSQSELSTLSQRVGIAHETRRQSRGKAPTVASSRRNNMMIGCGF